MLFAGEHTHTRYYSTVTGAYITGQAQAQFLARQMTIINNDTEMLVKANTDDFNRMQWKREEPPWQTPATSRRHEYSTTTNDGAGPAHSSTAYLKDVVTKPACGLTTYIFKSVARFIYQAVSFWIS